MTHRVSKKVAPRPAIFLDRDGTLNEDSGYLYEISAWRWLSGVPEALAMFASCGYALVVVTNQSGIARGYYTSQAMHTLHTWVQEQLAKQGLYIEAFYHCPHHPNFPEPGFSAPCLCRKPSPYLLQKAAEDLHLDLSHSFMIGDKMSDVRAGLAAGCTSYLITQNIQNIQDTHNTHNTEVLLQDFHRVGSLLEAAQRICLP